MLDENTEVALRFMTAMSTSDSALAATCVAPDASAIAKGYGKFAGSRPAEVMVGMIASFNQLLPTGLNLSIVSTTAQGDRVVVEAEGDGTTVTGVPYRNQYCFVFTMKNGKIWRANEYFCTIHADEVLWPIVSTMGVGAQGE